MQRNDGRAPDEIRPINFELNVAPHASGSVLVSIGKTRVICAVTIEETVPRWMKEQNVTGGWLTAEYSMLPYSTQPRKPRDITKGRIDGRSVEIQRLIGRSLRAVVDLEKLGPRTIWVDCDVLQADGGTRTTAITGASLALAIACRRFVREKKLVAPPMLKLVAAISAGVLDGKAIVDLNYDEDKNVAVDFNLVATEDSEFVEVQSSGEEATFTGSQLDEMLTLGRNGISALYWRPTRCFSADHGDAAGNVSVLRASTAKAAGHRRTPKRRRILMHFEDGHVLECGDAPPLLQLKRQTLTFPAALP